MYKSILCFLAFLVSSQCKSSQKELAPVSKTDFIKITAELYFMEAHFQSVSLELLDSLMLANRNKIYQEYNTSDSLYQISKHIYNADNKEFKEMENAVKSELERYKAFQ